MAEQPRKLEPLNSYEIPGRGRVWLMVEPDPVLQIGESVEIRGRVDRIVGLERHPVAGGPQPGGKVGVMVSREGR